MKPDFALTLSFDGISLLRRVAGGWTGVGDVALDAADLRGALADLRTEADALSPVGGQVKLVVPNEQIKYLSLPDTGLSGGPLETEIRAALDGATPYAAEELSLDWSQADGQIYVAAVANETLDEAEAFAKSHHFEPVSFAAIAPDGQFVGDVFFGQASSWSGDAPTKDNEAIVIVPAPIAEETTPQPVPEEPVDLVEDSFSDEAINPGAALSEQPDEDLPELPSFRDAPGPKPKADENPVLAVEATAATPAPSFASIRASRNATPPPSAPIVPPVTEDAPASPRFRLGGANKSTRNSDVTAPVLQVEAVEEPVERKGFGFFTSRKPKVASAPENIPAEPSLSSIPKATAEQLSEPKPKHDPTPARAAVARIAAMRAGKSADAKAKTRPKAPDERQRMTVFGARTEPQIGGKPRFLGLMLTSLLLMLLLAVAAWASVFLDEGLARFFDRDNQTPSIARLPDVELLPLDGSVTAPNMDDGVRHASLNTDEQVVQNDSGLSDILPPPAALTSDEAEAKYAATGIWQRSPTAPATPNMTTLEDLYVASIDGRVQQFDAVALPRADDLRNDETYLSIVNPPLPGSRYTLDERGLVIATPEGTLNPEGVRVFAGLPPVVPPARPTAPVVEPVEPSEETVAVISPLQKTRPRGRPSGLVESNERATLAGSTRAELAAFRPKTRPATLKAVEEEAQPEATKFAVAQSVEPVTRPRDFSRIVARAREIQQSQPAQVTQVVAVAPRTVQPRIPSRANVARQATVTNAINLRRINLIGVYGKPSSRRALVRLSNGRYQKVAVGDRLDGGRVAAIGDSELRYSKNGRNVVLDMPDG